MNKQVSLLTRAFSALQSGDLRAAKSLLGKCKLPQAAQLRGVVARREGRYELARQHLVEATRNEPRNPEVHHNLALVLLDLGQTAAAIDVVGRALALKPDFLAAQRTLGRALRLAGRWAAAREFYAGLLARVPADVSARYGLASAELELGDVAAALHGFEQLIADGATDPSIYFMRGRAELAAGELERARASLEHAYAHGPNELALRELGRLYFMLNDQAAFKTLTAGPFEDVAQARVALQLLRQSGVAPQRLPSVATPDGRADAAAEAIVAQAFVDHGQVAPALAHAQRALALAPGNDAATAALISAHLMQGDTDAALALCASKKKEQPKAQQWLAYEATALRLSDREAYTRLVDVQQHVRTYELPLPDGYASLAQFNAELEVALDRLQPFKAQPIDQSLRLGTQTTQDLRWVRDPVVTAYLRALDAPIRDYMAAVGCDPDHPLTARNTGEFALAGCWSVRLHGGGHHVNHMHPEGWISSAYYVRVPESPADSRSGWIKFGEPPFVTHPVLEPEHWVQPRAGLLVLFPSYLWHGTAPISDGAVRITAPFDVVPADADTSVRV